jgi:hypothetical protein
MTNVSPLTVGIPVCMTVSCQRTVDKLVLCVQEKRREGILVHVTGQILERCVLYCIVLYCIIFSERCILCCIVLYFLSTVYCIVFYERCVLYFMNSVYYVVFY